MWGSLRKVDPLLFLIPAGLSLLGLVFIFALSFEQVGWKLAGKQAAAIALGWIAVVVLTYIDYRSWRTWRFWIYILTVLALILTLLIGTTQFGATSWIDVGPIQIQPSEFAKLTTITLLASFLHTPGKKVSGTAFILSLLAIMVPLALVLMQPDLGTALVIACSSVLVVLAAKLQLWQRLLVIGGIVAVCSSIYLSFLNVQPFDSLLKDYQKDRLASFVDPERDPKGSGYNVRQSKITVGSGGMLGQGLGNGSQSQLNFLPVAHTDFIFAAIAEAWGWLGAAGLTVAFLALGWRILLAAKNAPDEFGYLMALGIVAVYSFQFLVNTGMNIGIMPVTGIPLPFVSAGGTSILAAFVGIGFLQALVVRSHRGNHS